MGVPSLAPGIKQQNDVAGLGINGRQVATLVAVAEGTTEGEVVQVGLATVLFGDDVIDLVRCKAESLRNPAVFAATRGALVDQPPQTSGDKGPAHA